VACLFRHGLAEQRAALQPDLLGPDAHRIGAGLDPATTPLFTLLVAHFLTPDEKIDPAKVVALLAGFAGVAVLIGPGMLVDGSSVWGEAACLGAALSYAFAGVYGRRFKILKVAPIEAAAGQVTASTVLTLPIMLAVDQPWTLPAPPSVTVWAALGGLAVLSTALAYALYFRILAAAAGATNLLLVTFLIPSPPSCWARPFWANGWSRVTSLEWP
jgi:drug/metabolite transporter (DMT)-like permease